MTVAVQSVVVVLVGFLQVVLGGALVQLVFRIVDHRERSAEPGSPDRPGEEQTGPLQAAGRQLRGGAWIGALERLAVYATLLAGFPEGVAIVLGVKGLARYPELQATTAGAAERFIIGTFTSVLLAAGAAGLTRVLLPLVAG